MSLINQMLRDLETRRADSSETGDIPDEVRPLPAVGGERRRPLALLVVAVVAAAVAWAVLELATPTAPAPAANEAEAGAAAVVHEFHESPLRLDPELARPHIPSAAPDVPSAAPDVPPAAPALPPATAPVRPREMERPVPRAQKDVGVAAGVADMKIEKRPPATDAATAALNRARELRAAGQHDAALAALRQGLASQPGHIPLRQTLFGWLIEQRRHDEALALLGEGLALHPEQTQWAMNAARLQVDRDDVAGAWETLQASLPAAGTQGEYRAFCGTVLARLKRHGEAIPHYQAALRTNPGEGRWWIGLALAFEADGKAAEARAAFARALETGRLPDELATYAEGKLKQ